MMQLTAIPRASVIDVLRKAWQWCRIGLALHRLRRVNEEDRVFANMALSRAMGDARGLGMKIGQFLAGFDDNSSPYHDLVVNYQPIPLKKLKPELEKYLNSPAEQVFKVIDEATAAASLGQVHHAVLVDGTEVAAKIRYPGIIEAVQAELALSDRLPSGGPVKRWQINTADYKNVLRRQLLRETDYLIEMQTQQRFKRNLRVPGLHIPEIYPQFCSDGLLVQSWESGCRFNEVCLWSKQDRLEIGRTLLMALFQGLFVHGEVHGDPHPGNYLFNHDPEGKPQTILLDFGCTILVSKQSRLALLKLIDFCHAGGKSDCDPMGCFIAMGFDAEKLGHLQADMPELCNLLLRPFLADRPFQMNQWQLSKSLKALLDEKRWWFRAAGPAELFLLLRAFHGLSQQLEKLDVALPWWPLLQHVVGDQLLEHARMLELPPVPSYPATIKPIYDRARKLCVSLIENGINRVAVDLPAEAVFDLESIIPGQVLLFLLTSSDVDFAVLRQKLRKEGLLPQTLFDFKSGTKHCRIWLE